MVVVLVTGLSFAGYVAGKRLGAARGTLAAAAIAATVSSTAVISELSRRLRNPEEDAAVLKAGIAAASGVMRSEEHTSELQSLMRNSYAVFCLKKKIKTHRSTSEQSIM